MKNNKMKMEDRLDCFGEFHSGDAICAKFCAVNLRCAIERDEKARVEILEELVFSDHMLMKMQ